jgi:hypothetical protein
MSNLKAVSVVSILSKRLGGKWKYRGGTWECDDGIRTVRDVLTEVDHTGEYTGASQKCLYYRDGHKSPEWIYFI